MTATKSRDTKDGNTTSSLLGFGFWRIFSFTLLTHQSFALIFAAAFPDDFDMTDLS
jgi:hypothetical protein